MTAYGIAKPPELLKPEEFAVPWNVYELVENSAGFRGVTGNIPGAELAPFTVIRMTVEACSLTLVGTATRICESET